MTEMKGQKRRGTAVCPHLVHWSSVFRSPQVEASVFLLQPSGAPLPPLPPKQKHINSPDMKDRFLLFFFKASFPAKCLLVLSENELCHNWYSLRWDKNSPYQFAQLLRNSALLWHKRSGLADTKTNTRSPMFALRGPFSKGALVGKPHGHPRECDGVL